MRLDEQIAQAEAFAADLAANPSLADVELDEIARAAEAERLARIAERTRRVRAAQARVAELRARAERRHVAVDAHEAAERAEAKRITAAGKALAESRDQLAAASRAAVEALGALWDAGRDHDALVAQTAAELRAAGLPLRYQDGDVVEDFTTGGGTDGAVVLKGQRWTRLSSTWLVRRAAFGALRSRIGDEAAGTTYSDEHVAGLLDKAPLPAPYVPESPWTLLSEATRAQHAAMQPQVSEEARRRHEQRQREEQQEAERRRASGLREYGERRAELIGRVGEARVRELEAEQFIDGRPWGLEWSGGQPVRN